MLVSIHQPNYFPWAGYYYKIFKANTFIFFDDIQYTKNSFINRSYIIENLQRSWLTIPVNSSSNSLIYEVYVADKDWKGKHLSKLKNSYQKASCFKEVWPFIIDIFEKIDKHDIAHINQKIILETSKLLNIKTNFTFSSNLKIDKSLKGDDRLISLIKKVGGKSYLSGTGGKKYQNEKKFYDNRINLIYSSYEPVKYEQNTSTFFEGLSILDMLFNLGIEKSTEMIKK